MTPLLDIVIAFYSAGQPELGRQALRAYMWSQLWPGTYCVGLRRWYLSGQRD